MQFPKLQMLAEAKRKKPADDEMDFDLDSGDLDLDDAPIEKKTKSAGEKKAAPAGLKAKGDEAIADKGAVLKFLKDTTPADRKSICAKLQKMVEADEAALEESLMEAGKWPTSFNRSAKK